MTQSNNNTSIDGNIANENTFNGGTKAMPGFHKVEEPGVGVYSDAPGVIGLSTNATSRLEINEHGHINVGKFTTVKNSPPTNVSSIAVVDNGYPYLGIFSSGGAKYEAVPSLTFWRSRGSIDSPTSVKSGDALAAILFKGYTGDGFHEMTAAHIYVEATEDHSPTSLGTKILFRTTPNNSNVPITAFEVLDSGSIRAKFIHNNTGTQGNISSGTHIPNLFVASSNIIEFKTNPTQWMRVGNVVTLSGLLEIFLQKPGSYEFTLENPYALTSNFTQPYQLAGTGAVDDGSSLMIVADTMYDRARFVGSSSTTGAKIITFQYTYVINK